MPKLLTLFVVAILLGFSLQGQSRTGLAGNVFPLQPPSWQEPSHPDSPTQPGTQKQPPLLTREEAERMAVNNNPRVKVGQLLARVQGEVIRETRANLYPDVSGDITGVEANQATRISSGSLTSSRLLQHAGAGVQVSQLLTDFGRTRNLIASAVLREKARQADALATQQDIILAADQAFYQTLEAQATLEVARQTVEARQTLADQVSALTSTKLRSNLDLSFAQVNLSQAKLLQLSARSNLDSARAALAAVLGVDRPVEYQLVDDGAGLSKLPSGVDELVAQAIRNRPDLQSVHLSEQSAQKLSVAQRQQLLPSIDAIGVVGYTPWGATQYYVDNWYGAVGVNINVPIFSGFRYNAQAAEARLQASAEAERARDLSNVISRDVRTAWLNANANLQRVSVTADLLKQANLGLELAKTRYGLGLSSIVELSQAQLQQTQAAIDNANARAQYGLSYAELQFQLGSTH